MRKINFIYLLILLVLSYCSTTDSRWDKINNICGQEPCYEGPFELPWISAYDAGVEFRDQYGKKLSCDNKVMETNNVLTFSDASSDEVKIQFAYMTEISFAEIKKHFEIKTSAELGITDIHSKMTIYSNRYKDHWQNSTPKGFILYALDNTRWGNSDDPDFLDWYQRMVKHETMHVVEFYITGTRFISHKWFNEGLAEHVCGGTWTPITSWEQIEEWLVNPEHVNPITIHSASDYPVPLSRVGEYYPIFRLAVDYLLDPRGLGKTILEIKAMFQDMGSNKVEFADAFEIYMGISVSYYEEHFFEQMEAYLML